MTKDLASAGVPEDINVFELPGPSDGESDSGDGEEEEEDNESDDQSEWVMASPAGLPETSLGKRGAPKGGSIAMPGKKRKGDKTNVFASAEEYADLLNEDVGGAEQSMAPRARKGGKDITKRRKQKL